MSSSELMNVGLMDRSLKGLLMDKGKLGLETKIRRLLQKIASVQAAMEGLVEQQRLSREQSGCDCLDLYLALSLKPDLTDSELNEIKAHGARVVLYTQTKQPLAIEWRARKGFADAYGYAQSKRIHPFHPGREHYAQVREYVSRTPGYYEIMAGYDAVRVTLNAALKSIRRDVVDLNMLVHEIDYPAVVAREADKAAKRFFKRLPDSEAVAQVLNDLYGQEK